MRRREFIGGIGASAALLRSAARAAEGRPIVGILRVNSREAEVFIEQFRRDMSRLGWDDGRNIDFAVRWAGGRNDHLAGLTGELIGLSPAVMVTFGNAGVQAIQAATGTIPIVGMTDDMVGSGLAASMARPGGNTTGVSILGSELDVKRLELLHEFVPQARRFGIIADPANSRFASSVRVQKAAQGLGLEVQIVNAQNPEEIQRALDALSAAKVEGVVILASPILNAARASTIARLREIRLPAVHEWPETAEEGGLIGYGPRLTLCYRHIAVLVDKVLRGAKPADLPIEQPTVITLVINATVAKQLGLLIPPGLMLRADEVIE